MSVCPLSLPYLIGNNWTNFDLILYLGEPHWWLSDKFYCDSYWSSMTLRQDLKSKFQVTQKWNKRIKSWFVAKLSDPFVRHSFHLKRFSVLWIWLRCDLQLHTEVTHFGSVNWLFPLPPGSHFRSQGGTQSPQPEGVTVPHMSKLHLLTDPAPTSITVFGSCRLATCECIHHTCNYEPGQRSQECGCELRGWG